MLEVGVNVYEEWRASGGEEDGAIEHLLKFAFKAMMAASSRSADKNDLAN